MAVRTVRPQARPLSRAQDPMGKGSPLNFPISAGFGGEDIADETFLLADGTVDVFLLNDNDNTELLGDS